MGVTDAGAATKMAIRMQHTPPSLMALMAANCHDGQTMIMLMVQLPIMTHLALTSPLANPAAVTPLLLGGRLRRGGGGPRGGNGGVRGPSGGRGEGGGDGGVDPPRGVLVPAVLVPATAVDVMHVGEVEATRRGLGGATVDARVEERHGHRVQELRPGRTGQE
jgi:hypothetical protein